MQDKKVRDAFLVKLGSYHLLPTIAPLKPEIKTISEKYDTSENDRNDTALLNELYSGRVDSLLTEDRKIHKKGKDLGIDDKIFTIESLLEKFTSENPEFVDYNILAVKKEYFGNINLMDEFFDSLRETYPDFDNWFTKKSDALAYVCRESGKVIAFLYLKVEGRKEQYNDINPVLKPKNRLKIGTFKVQLNGFKLGERFLKIIFDNAMKQAVNELYVTIIPKNTEQIRLIELLKEYGFYKHGIKTTQKYGDEEVYVRDFSPMFSKDSPKLSYPYYSKKTGKFIVSILPEFHTNLFPDSILNTESPDDFVENEPYRNAISKVFVSGSPLRDLKSGDIIIFYRTGGAKSGVITTLGVVENVQTHIRDFDHFKILCRKRSVFTEDELKELWRIKKRPFVVNFLYSYTFPKRMSFGRLIELRIIPNPSSAPMGFKRLNDQDFEHIIRETGSNDRFIVN
jgi:hypothetical protein